jgi:hypothetical protein
MSCTKLFQNGILNKRLFRIYDKNLAWQVNLNYMLQMPRLNNQTEMWEKDETINMRVSSQRAGKKLLDNIKNNKVCLKCNNNTNSCKIKKPPQYNLAKWAWSLNPDFSDWLKTNKSSK